MGTPVAPTLEAQALSTWEGTCRTGLRRQRQKQREGKKEREVEERRMNKDYTAL